MKKVLIFTYSTKLGGSELNAYKIVKLSSKIKFDWLVLNSANSDLTNKIKNCNNLKNYFSLYFSGIFSFQFFKCIFSLFNILKKNDYQTIYAVGFIPGLLISIIKPFFSFRFISTRRERMSWAKFYHHPFIYFINFMSDYIETNSKSIQIELKKSILTKRKVYFLPNIILRSKVKKHKIFKSTKRYIGNVANVRGPKNIDLFLSLALKTINNNKDIIFILVGRDSSNRKVKNFINNNKLQDRLIIMEDINYDEIFSIYLGLDIFLFTSKYEGSPNVIYEAMSESLPIIASRIFATEEIIDNGIDGFLCNLENENEFVDKINLLINDEKKYQYIKNNTLKKFKNFNYLDLAIKEINNKMIWVN